MNTVTFTTDLFERTHGSAPRRKDYGCWIFLVDGAYVERTGEFLDVKRALSAELGGGEYQLQP